MNLEIRSNSSNKISFHTKKKTPVVAYAILASCTGASMIRKSRYTSLYEAKNSTPSEAENIRLEKPA